MAILFNLSFSLFVNGTFTFRFIMELSKDVFKKSNKVELSNLGSKSEIITALVTPPFFALVTSFSRFFLLKISFANLTFKSMSPGKRYDPFASKISYSLFSFILSFISTIFLSSIKISFWINSCPLNTKAFLINSIVFPKLYNFFIRFYNCFFFNSSIFDSF